MTVLAKNRITSYNVCYTKLLRELQARIFELNFTTKREGNFGLGIGLHVCQQIIAQHSGRIEVSSEPSYNFV